MSKTEKEYARRVRKMQKHVEALRSLTERNEIHNVLDEIEEQLAFLRGDHPSQVPKEDRSTAIRPIA